MTAALSLHHSSRARCGSRNCIVVVINLIYCFWGRLADLSRTLCKEATLIIIVGKAEIAIVNALKAVIVATAIAKYFTVIIAIIKAAAFAIEWLMGYCYCYCFLTASIWRNWAARRAGLYLKNCWKVRKSRKDVFFFQYWCLAFCLSIHFVIIAVIAITTIIADYC